MFTRFTKIFWSVMPAHRFLPALLFVAVSARAQNVGINTTGSAGHSSAMLDVSATDKGMLVPRVSLVDVSNGSTPILSPADGLLVYNTNAATVGGYGVGFYYWSGAGWVKVATGTVSIATNNGITGGTITSTGTIGLTGQALALHNLGTDGLIVRTGAGTVSTRSIGISGTGVAITNGDGISGNPVINLDYGSMGTAATSGNPKPVGNFGQFRNHSTYTDFNTTPDYWGWNYVQGTGNAPNAVSGQWYRQNISLGADYPGRGSNGYSLELAYPRFNGAAAGVWMRTVENGSIGSWLRVDAGAIGSGTTNYHAKWTSASTLGNSLVYDNGTNVGIGTTGPAEALHVTGNVRADGIVFWGNGLSRSESRSNAGLQGDAGARSGFFETDNPNPAGNWPLGAASWWHLLDVRHSNNGNNYAMQMAGGFFDQRFYLRKTNNSASQPWKEIVTVAQSNGVNDNTVWLLSANFSHSADDWCVGCSGTGNLPDGDDNNALVNIGFTVRIDGVDYTQVTVSQNGWVAFGNQTAQTAFANAALPTTVFNTPVIFPYWDDLRDYGAGEVVRWGLVGASPNRTFLVDYSNQRINGQDDTRRVNFQVQIHETSGLINIKYRAPMHPEYNGQSATIGFQLNQNKAYSISYNAKILDDNRADSEGWSISPVR